MRENMFRSGFRPNEMLRGCERHPDRNSMPYASGPRTSRYLSYSQTLLKSSLLAFIQHDSQPLSYGRFQ